jgi:regulator of protease activity HflC (stomatin/prohibitin superfamily)
MAEDDRSKTKSDIENPPIYEPGIMFPAGKAWWIVGLLWFIPGIALLYRFDLGWLFITSYIIAFMAWLFVGARQINGDQRAKSLFIGKITKGVIGPGLTFTIYPLEELRIYPTTVQQIALTDPGTPAKIQSKAGLEERYKDDGITKYNVQIPKLTLEVDPVLSFQWPWNDEELTAAVKNTPHPENLLKLKNLIEEPVLDVIRTAGGQRDYIWITQNRTDFAEEVIELFKESKDLAKLINLYKLKNTLPSFKHIKLPQSVLDGQAFEVVAHNKGNAKKIETVLEAEGRKIGMELEGEGKGNYEALVRKKILDVLTNQKYTDVAMKLEAMKAFVDASQGGKGTIIIPTEFLSVLGGMLGGKSSSNNVLGDLENAGISREKLAQIIMSELAQKKG